MKQTNNRKEIKIKPIEETLINSEKESGLKETDETSRLKANPLSKVISISGPKGDSTRNPGHGRRAPNVSKPKGDSTRNPGSGSRKTP